MHRLTSAGPSLVVLAFALAACHGPGREPVSATQTTAAEVTTSTPPAHPGVVSALPAAPSGPTERALPPGNDASSGTAFSGDDTSSTDGSLSAPAQEPLVSPDLVSPGLVEPGLDNRGVYSPYTSGRAR
ncbi:MAG: hypothetical protein JWP97_3451 [Labilithrix sp.]|nr:hypothetical protein [Labilithrix sp.]